MPTVVRQKTHGGRTELDGMHMEEIVKDNITYTEHNNGSTEMSFSTISDKTSPSVRDNDKTLTTATTDDIKTYKEALLGW